MKILCSDYYKDDAVTAAKNLLGKILVHETDAGITKCRIIETEAYMGAIDKASHAYQNRNTPRTSTLFEAGGISYVYLIYGMYSCMNVVVNRKGLAQGVLIRACQPLDGLELMKERRHTDIIKNLCNGPGKLCMAMDITKNENRLSLTTSCLYLTEPEDTSSFDIISSKRINIDYAEEAKDYPWRFLVKDSPFISAKP